MLRIGVMRLYRDFPGLRRTWVWYREDGRTVVRIRFGRTCFEIN